MIAHVVLFKPKASLSRDERAQFVTALEDALNSIPLIKRARLGRRVTVGRPYDGLNAVQFPYVAILEFDSAGDLHQYLHHPAHEALGAQFYAAADAALAYDFDLIDGSAARQLLDE